MNNLAIKGYVNKICKKNNHRLMKENKQWLIMKVFIN